MPQKLKPSTLCFFVYTFTLSLSLSLVFHVAILAFCINPTLWYKMGSWTIHAAIVGDHANFRDGEFDGNEIPIKVKVKVRDILKGTNLGISYKMDLRACDLWINYCRKMYQMGVRMCLLLSQGTRCICCGHKFGDICTSCELETYIMITSKTHPILATFLLRALQIRCSSPWTSRLSMFTKELVY